MQVKELADIFDSDDVDVADREAAQPRGAARRQGGSRGRSRAHRDPARLRDEGNHPRSRQPFPVRPGLRRSGSARRGDGVRLRGHPLGGPCAPRPDRAPRRAPARPARPAPDARPAGAARPAARVGRRHARLQRPSSRAPGRRRRRPARAPSPRRRHEGGRGGEGRRGEPALHRAARRSPSGGRRGGGEPPDDGPRPRRRPPRRLAGRGAGRHPRRLDRRPDLLAGCHRAHRARPGLPPRGPCRARATRPDPPGRGVPDRGRRAVVVQARTHPGRRVRPSATRPPT